MRTSRWALLAVVVAVQSVGTWLANAPLFLIAHLHLVHGLSLAHAGFLASTALWGGVLTLIAWGALADRIGERRCLALGLMTGSMAGVASSLNSSPAWLASTWFVIGVGTASLNSASGRLIVGWFRPTNVGQPWGFARPHSPLASAWPH
jgi:MFS family permease